MLTVRPDPETEARLEKLAQATRRSKSHYVKQALRQYLEDREDYLHAVAALERKEPRVSLKKLRKEFGLADRVHPNRSPPNAAHRQVLATPHTGLSKGQSRRAQRSPSHRKAVAR
ncbi:MAG TPA: ribbon-helix-helix domain-containing protein [Ferrovibrio sp.]|uniref:type II toxin-antitoxin system RelB family antitoxin n=1 Tax=Ferrovibrio sp. TaxID=1917215 RepID=UPI002ED0340F